MCAFYLKPILLVTHFILKETYWFWEEKKKHKKCWDSSFFSSHIFGMSTAPHSVDFNCCLFQVLFTSISIEPVLPPCSGIYQPIFVSQKSLWSFHWACWLRMAVSWCAFATKTKTIIFTGEKNGSLIVTVLVDMGFIKFIVRELAIFSLKREWWDFNKFYFMN